MSDSKQRSDLDVVIGEAKRLHRELQGEFLILEMGEETPMDQDTQVFLRYMVDGDPKRAASWANEQGWKPGRKKRGYKEEDVLALASVPPTGWSVTMFALVKTSCFDERGRLNTGKMMG